MDVMIDYGQTIDYNNISTVVQQIFIEHSRRAEYGLESACDRESVVVRLISSVEPQHCRRKGSAFRLIAANHRYAYQQYFVPNIPKLIKIFYYLPTFTAPYFFAVLPIALLNVYVVYRVAKESWGVWFHLAQAIGDIFILIVGLLSISGASLIFAPLFAFFPFCQSIVQITFSRFAVFGHNFSLYSMVLLWHNRYVAICFPEKYFCFTGSRVWKSLVGAFVLAVVPASIDVLKLISVVSATGIDPYKFWTISMISDCAELLCCAIGISLIMFYTIKTAQQAKYYKPPEESSNSVETIVIMKRFYRLTVQVLALNAAMILISVLYNVLRVALDVCEFKYSFYMPDVCNTLKSHMDSLFYLSDWSPHLTVLTSNIGLIVHSIFSRAYRKEVVKIFNEFKALIRCKHTTTVVPI